MHKWQARQVWPHLLFLTGRGPSKMLVGEPPQPRLFGTKCPKEVGCVTATVAAVPYRPVRPSVRANGQYCGLPLGGEPGRYCEKHCPSFGTFCPKGSSFNCSVRNYYRDNLQSQQNTLRRPPAQIPGLCLPQNPIVCIQEFYRFQYLR